MPTSLSTHLQRMRRTIIAKITSTPDAPSKPPFGVGKVSLERILSLHCSKSILLVSHLGPIISHTRHKTKADITHQRHQTTGPKSFNSPDLNTDKGHQYTHHVEVLEVPTRKRQRPDLVHPGQQPSLLRGRSQRQASWYTLSGTSFAWSSFSHGAYKA